MARFGNHCVYCNNRVWFLDAHDAMYNPQKSRATVDHAMPKSRGGLNDDANLLLACAACNNAKADMTDAEFRAFIATGRVPIGYVEYLAERIRKQTIMQIPHIARPIEA